MSYSIQNDECFDTLVRTGLLQDLVNISIAIGGKFDVVATKHGWAMTIKNEGRTLQLEKKIGCLELAILDLKRSKQYPCDAESAVGAAIDMMKASARK